MEVLEKIEKLRKERGWSINNLAMEALLTQSTLNNLYARKAEPKLSTLRAICNAFGISLAEFFADDAEEKKEETLSIDAEIIRYVRLPEQGAENRAFGSAQIHALNLFCAAERTGCLRCDFLTQLS